MDIYQLMKEYQLKVGLENHLKKKKEVQYKNYLINQIKVQQ